MRFYLKSRLNAILESDAWKKSKRSREAIFVWEKSYFWHDDTANERLFSERKFYVFSCIMPSLEVKIFVIYKARIHFADLCSRLSLYESIISASKSEDSYLREKKSPPTRMAKENSENKFPFSSKKMMEFNPINLKVWILTKYAIKV